MWGFSSGSSALLARKGPKLVLLGKLCGWYLSIYKVRSGPLLLPHVETKRARCLGVGRVEGDKWDHSGESAGCWFSFLFLFFILFLFLPRDRVSCSLGLKLPI